ncbi:MAG: methyltransferase domain-containing protein [Candidatus Omnitrophica bacterium]|nr:methyltransferase domain-containing protein [Candidatus Omnitrophota bacterium]
MREKLTPKFNLPLEEILSRKPLVLDLASGDKAINKKRQGRVTTDILDLANIDIVCDLNEGLTFLPDNSVDEIYSAMTLEHIENLTGLMNEIHRILKPWGKKFVIVPHFSNPYSYSDPTHKNYFGLYSFHYFSKADPRYKRSVPGFYFKNKFEVLKLRLLFSSPLRFTNLICKIIERIVNVYPIFQEIYESSFCYIFPCYAIYAEIKPIK